MASIRRVRKDFRQEVLRLISTGDGSIEMLVKNAGQMFGHDVGYEVLIKTFLHNEVANAVSYLRNEGLVETIGKQWKTVDGLNQEDIEVIQVRRKKRIRGELKAGKRMAHERGDVDMAAMFGAALNFLNTQDAEVVQPESAEQR